jgi:hypothetical protein
MTIGRHSDNGDEPARMGYLPIATMKISPHISFHFVLMKHAHVHDKRRLNHPIAIIPPLTVGSGQHELNSVHTWDHFLQSQVRSSGMPSRSSW